jgi:hypothetical protein
LESAAPEQYRFNRRTRTGGVFRISRLTVQRAKLIFTKGTDEVADVDVGKKTVKATGATYARQARPQLHTVSSLGDFAAARGWAQHVNVRRPNPNPLRYMMGP